LQKKLALSLVLYVNNDFFTYNVLL
jgi:hypothetical protein